MQWAPARGSYGLSRLINTFGEEPMSSRAQTAPAEKGFESSRAQFDALVVLVSSTEMMAVTHSELEERVALEGREVLRRLVQDHLDLRAVRESAERLQSIRGEDGIDRV